MNCPHCDKPIDEHEANRCLDAWVAEAVMGIPVVAHGPLAVTMDTEGKMVPYGNDAYFEEEGYEKEQPFLASLVSDYSTDIAAAWEVVERAEIHTIRRVASQEDDSPSEWAAIKYLDPITHGVAISARLAICRAALKASGGE